MVEGNIYTVGGTVQAGGGVYIKRQADYDLLALCKKGEWACILSSRQVGKSSLMVRTAQELEKEQICSVIVDLSAIGVQISSDEWYLGILNEIYNALHLETNIFEWWEKYEQLSPTQRLINFFRDILLKEIKDRIVLFFDEIDSILSMSFSMDDFFAALRAIYNARSTTPDFMRLSFVLIGVATPSDLITDNKRTPYNIGRQVELTDFTLEEAEPLSAGLGLNGEVVLAQIFEFTGGHPYLTQLICAYMAKNAVSFTKEAVQNTVKLLFEGEQGRQDNNLRFVRDMLTKRAPDVQRVLRTYKEIRSGKKIPDDERSAIKAHLKISGVVRRLDGFLVPRNHIYEKAFDLDWIKDNTPSQLSRRLMFASSLLSITTMVLLALTGQLNQFIYRPLRMEFVRIPQGEFLMGSENPTESPVHEVQLDAYEIGKYEVTNKQFNQCVLAGKCKKADWKYDAQLADYPVTNVSWYDADTFCRWNGGRLPTEAEWEKAARGTHARTYPWGDTKPDCSLANFVDCGINGAMKVGSYIKGVSPYGVYDMAGNVWEWIADWYNVYPNGDASASGNFGEIFRVLRGGSWINDHDSVRSAYRFLNDATIVHEAIGFRCVRVTSH